ncbi:MAG TPA: NUDIX domain-containing protein [Puia sp.]|nr:NUDIX domain-containing protein [Puia sp.]
MELVKEISLMLEIPSYQEKDHILLAVDCIIFGFNGERLNILCIKRDFEPGLGKWSLMGGFVGKQESVREAASRVLETLTGLHNIYMEELNCYGEVNRDPGGRVVSIAYYALININQYPKELLLKHNARWFDADSIPNLIFDHKKMVRMAIKQLQEKAINHPLGFVLLPKKFTMNQLQTLYEAIFNVKFDQRNFSRKLFSLNILRKLNEKDKTSSRKGSFYYIFDEEEYKKLDKQGIQFI